MERTQEDGAVTSSGDRYRWVLVFSVDGDLRFISHQDTLRLFRRALVRAEVPVRYTEGFNPHPRITIPVPRPVGVGSQAEVIVLETTEPIDPDDLLRRLQRCTPDDLRMISAQRLPPGRRLEPALVRYRLEIDGSPAQSLKDRMHRLLESDALPVERMGPKDHKIRLVDIRPYLVDIRLQDDTVEFTLRVTAHGTAKPAEVAGLLGFDAGSINHRIRRMEVQWR